MRFADRLAVPAIVVVGLLLAAGNLWFTAARSTLPLDLHGRIERLEIRHEKHPGFDDVYFLVLDNGRKLHVDRPVYFELSVGDTVQKNAFELQMQIERAGGGQVTLPLKPSADFRGMRVVMPIVLATSIVLAICAARSRRMLQL